MTKGAIPDQVRDDVLALAASFDRNKTIILRALRKAELPEGWLDGWEEKLKRLRAAVQPTGDV